jgi:antitoxin (DNA-binding transcriptional repressor) of toxin-antitoxin stability system
MTHGVSHDTDQVQVYTMRHLNQHTASTIEEINQSGKPAIITRHGRFVAAIYPLAHKPGIESRAVARALEELDDDIRSQLTGESRVSRIYTAQEAVDELGVNADVDRADRERDRSPYWRR